MSDKSGNEQLRLHCGGCDLVHDADSAFVYGHPCPMCGWELALADGSVPTVGDESAMHQETLRQLAEVTAELDALAAHAERLTEALSREDLRDPLRARVEELEAEVRALRTYNQFSDL
jgi:hypothetical protein